MRTDPVWQEAFEVGQIYAPIAWIVGGFLIGWLIYRFAFRKIRSAVTLTSWGGDDIVVHAIHDVILIWFTLGGAFGALRSMPLRQDINDIIEKGLIAVLVLSGTWVLARVVADLIKLTVMKTGSARGSSTLLVNLARIFVFVVGILVLLQTLGISVGPLLGALGIGGLAVALALQETLASVFAGIQLLASKKIQPGDFIELASGQSGYVIDIDWRNTTVRTLPNNDVIIPNSVLSGQLITNYHRPVQEMSVLVQVGVSYDSDLEHVERVTIEVGKQVLQEVEGGVEEFDPFIRYHTFNDFSIDFTVILRSREFVNSYLLKHEFVKRLKKRYDQEGIVIPFPIRTLEFADGGVPEMPMPGQAARPQRTQ